MPRGRCDEPDTRLNVILELFNLTCDTYFAIRQPIGVNRFRRVWKLSPEHNQLLRLEDFHRYIHDEYIALRRAERSRQRGHPEMLEGPFGPAHFVKVARVVLYV